MQVNNREVVIAVIDNNRFVLRNHINHILISFQAN